MHISIRRGLARCVAAANVKGDQRDPYLTKVVSGESLQGGAILLLGGHWGLIGTQLGLYSGMYDIYCMDLLLFTYYLIAISKTEKAHTPPVRSPRFYEFC